MSRAAGLRQRRAGPAGRSGGGTRLGALSRMEGWFRVRRRRKAWSKLPVSNAIMKGSQQRQKPNCLKNSYKFIFNSTLQLCLPFKKITSVPSGKMKPPNQFLIFLAKRIDIFVVSLFIFENHAK